MASGFLSRPLLAMGMAVAFLIAAPMGHVSLSAQDNEVMGEIQFSGAGKVERDSGVWVDNQYVGYLKELKGSKKILLLPGEHGISVRQAGYENFEQKLIVEPGKIQSLSVRMEKDPTAQYPGANAGILKLSITPDRAAVFVDDGYIGHVSDFRGALHSMTVTPGEHRIKVELPGYRAFETSITLRPGQKSEIKTDLVKGSIQDAESPIKQLASVPNK
jgi:hypothetical protein